MKALKSLLVVGVASQCHEGVSAASG